MNTKHNTSSPEIQTLQSESQLLIPTKCNSFDEYHYVKPQHWNQNMRTSWLMIAKTVTFHMTVYMFTNI